MSTTLGNFYELGSAFLKSAIQVRSEALEIADHFELIRGDYSRWKFPLMFKQSRGSKYYDIIHTGCVNLFLISHHLGEVMNKYDLTGWKTFPVTIYDKQGSLVVGYRGLSIIGRSGPIIYNDATVFNKRLVPNGSMNKYYKGMFIDPDTWDKSDIFLPYGAYNIIVSQKACDVFLDEKISNLRLDNISDIEVDETIVKHVRQMQREK